MHFKKGKVIFGQRDTFSLHSILSQVILAGMVKFKETINKDNGLRKGVPAEVSIYMRDQGLITQEDYSGLSDESYTKCGEYYDYVIDEILYAFDESNEPDIGNYDFSYKRLTGEPDEDGLRPFKLDCTNDEEKERYSSDMKDYKVRCDKGRELFAKYYNTLWW